MKLPIWQPRDRQMSERRHYDPPALWYAVILGSVVIHLSAFGMLRLLMMAGLIGTPSATKLIPIDVIAMATPAAGIASRQPKTTAKPTKNPTASSNPTQNRKTASTSSPIRNKSQAGTTKPPAANTRKSPVSNSSKPSGKLPTNTKPNPSTGTNKQPSTGKNNQSGTTTPNSPSPTNKPTNKPTPNPQSGGGFIATVNNLAPISTGTDILNPGRDNDKLATLLNGNKQLSAEDLKQLGISLNQDLKLKVGVVVEIDGTATVMEKQVVVELGSISQEKAVAIAKKIIQQLRFNPTLGSDNQPKQGNYNLRLKISPTPK